MATSGVRKKKGHRTRKKPDHLLSTRAIGDLGKSLEAILNQFGVSLKHERSFNIYDNDPGIATYPRLAVARPGDTFHFTSLSTKEVALNTKFFETLDGKEPPPLQKLDSVVVKVKEKEKLTVFHGSPVVVEPVGVIRPSALLGDPEIIIVP